MSLRSYIEPYIPGFIWRPLRECKNLGALLTSKNYRFVNNYPPGHYYSPIPDIDDTRKNPTARDQLSTVRIASVDLNEAGQLRTAEALARHYDEMPFAEQPRRDLRYYLDNPYFSYGDGIALYLMIRHFQPRQIIEVGAGFSSAAMLDVNQLFFDGKIEFTFIEPNPERLYELLDKESRQRVRIIENPVQDVPITTFSELGCNDILFIDSSHVGKSRSDVLYQLFDILPSLQSGVIIHVHDILWPFEYPQRWFDDGRAWNEAYFVRAFLQYNQAFEIIYFNSYMEMLHHEWMQAKMPLTLKSPSNLLGISNSRLWLRKR